MPCFSITVDEQQVEITFPQFKISDYVTSKRLGLPGIGTIIGIEYAQVYANKALKKHQFKRWNELYPGWERRWIYTVYFTSSQKVQSLEEFAYDLMDLDEKQLKFMYDVMMKKSNLLAFPEEDIEIM